MGGEACGNKRGATALSTRSDDGSTHDVVGVPGVFADAPIILYQIVLIISYEYVVVVTKRCCTFFFFAVPDAECFP